MNRLSPRLLLVGIVSALLLLMGVLAAAQEPSFSYLPLVQKPCPIAPTPAATISAEATTLTVGETTPVTFSTNLGIPLVQLFANGERIASFAPDNTTYITNESAVVRMINDTYPPILEALEPGDIELAISVNGETGGFFWMDGECLPYWYFTTVSSSERLAVNAAP